MLRDIMPRFNLGTRRVCLAVPALGVPPLRRAVGAEGSVLNPRMGNK